MREEGFTLVELLLVIAMILCITALISPVMFNVRKKALVVSCLSNARQINFYLNSYAIENDGYIPRTCEDVEARLHDKKLLDRETGIPSLKGLIAMMSRWDPGAMRILKCPADTGSYGQDYYPTDPGKTCWQEFGQSFQVNVEVYENDMAPGYNPNFNGSMYGADPVKRDDIQASKRDPSRYMVLSDMWSHWHNEIVIGSEAKDHFLNILFFDGHVGGRGFDSSLDAKQFLNRNSTKRWWVPPEAPEED